MSRLLLSCIATLILLGFSVVSEAQQMYRLPDRKALKHVTTKQSTRVVDSKGAKATMDYYSAPNGQIITIYSLHGRNFAFSTHSNSDVQGSYRLFMDMTGDGNFQETRGGNWQVPPWVRPW